MITLSKQTIFLIFKDKYNAKPPGGKGFFPHFDGIFEFKDQEFEKLKKDAMTRVEQYYDLKN